MESSRTAITMKLINSDLLSRSVVFDDFTKDCTGGVIMDVILATSDRNHQLIYRIWEHVGEPGYIQMSVDIKQMTYRGLNEINWR
jgi:hypothetical protein